MQNTFGYRWVFKVIKEKDDGIEIREGEWCTSLKASQICSLLEFWGWDDVVYLNKQTWIPYTSVQDFPCDRYSNEVLL